MVNSENIKLTISILASNRKDTIPKCLESLRPLLEQVSSELIITDTGCDEDLVAYMKNYTDNIVKFEWCNDFAAARNVGLRLARGQWFMYIDDDEWFEDVSELIQFFNSDESEKYVAASYVVRNYKSLKGDTYSEGVVGRINRMYDGIEFVGKVHECIERMDGKTKQCTSYVHHYGYVFADEEKKKQHFERNTRLLEEEVANNPIDARNYAHIYQEYRLVNEPDIALEYALKALDNVDESVKGNKISMCSTYVCILWAYTRKNEYENVIRWGEDFMETKPMTGITQAAMNAYMANGYIHLEKYNEAKECTDKYLKLREVYEQDKERYYKELGPMLNDTFGDIQIGRAINSGLKAAIYTNDLGKVFEYILSFDWHRNVYMEDENTIEDMVKLVIEEKENTVLHKECIKAFGKIFTNVGISKVLLKVISEYKSRNMDEYTYLCDIMARVAGQVGYREMADIISTYKANKVDELLELYITVLSAETLAFSMDREFYQIALEKNIPIESMIECIDIAMWRMRVGKWIAKARNKEIIQCKKYMDKLISNDSIYMKIFEEEIVNELEKRKK